MKNCYLLLLIVALFGCSSNNTDTSSTEVKDTLQIDEKTPVLDELTLRSFPVLISEKTMKDSFPLKVTFIKEYVSPQKGFMNDNWYVEQFVKIDSIKSSGKYEEFVNALDIGQTKDARAFIYDTLKSQSGRVYIWGINYHSYEACPSFSGKNIYLTSVSNEGKYMNTIKLLENSSAMDAPVYGRTTGECIINENLFIVCKDTVVNGEYIQEKKKNYEETYTTHMERKLRVTNSGKIELLDTFRSKEKKEKVLSE